MFDNPVILNLHDDIRDSYIRKWMSGHHVSGRQKLMCGYPPSLARKSKYRKRHFGYNTKDESGPRPLFLYKIKLLPKTEIR